MSLILGIFHLLRNTVRLREILRKRTNSKRRAPSAMDPRKCEEGQLLGVYNTNGRKVLTTLHRGVALVRGCMVASEMNDTAAGLADAKNDNSHSSVGGGKASRVLNIRSVLSSKAFRIVARSKRA